jgi:environmental stress-induced protein Ves
MLLEGDGMVLDFDRGEPVHIAARFAPFTFDGAWRCDCTLTGGGVRDMNLMVDRETGRGSIEVAWPRQPLQRALRADWTLVYAIAGNVSATLGEAEYRLRTGELLRIDGASAEHLSLKSDDPDPAAAIIEVERQRR